MRYVRTPAALAAALTLAACGGFIGGGAADLRVAPVAPDIAAPCLHPREVAPGGDWEIYAGRLGDALLICRTRHAALLSDREGLAGIVSGRAERKSP